MTPTRFKPQRQDSLHDQMMDLLHEAERMGCRDAADWIRDRWVIRYDLRKLPKAPLPMGRGKAASS